MIPFSANTSKRLPIGRFKIETQGSNDKEKMILFDFSTFAVVAKMVQSGQKHCFDQDFWFFSSTGKEQKEALYKQIASSFALLIPRKDG